jgi:hypothetical protein
VHFKSLNWVKGSRKGERSRFRFPRSSVHLALFMPNLQGSRLQNTPLDNLIQGGWTNFAARHERPSRSSGGRSLEDNSIRSVRTRFPEAVVPVEHSAYGRMLNSSANFAEFFAELRAITAPNPPLCSIDNICAPRLMIPLLTEGLSVRVLPEAK